MPIGMQLRSDTSVWHCAVPHRSLLGLNFLLAQKSLSDCRAQDMYPVTVDDYDLVHVVGKGASATVRSYSFSDSFISGAHVPWPWPPDIVGMMRHCCWAMLTSLASAFYLLQSAHSTTGLQPFGTCTINARTELTQHLSSRFGWQTANP